MSHRAATVLPLILIAACAAAFLRTEQLKLRHSAVGHPHVRQAFSPGCTDPGCRHVARMRFMLRQAQVLTLAMVRTDGTVVRTLVSHRSYAKTEVRLTWDGTTDAGTQAPDGHYELRVTLAGGRNVTIPDPIVIDTVPPTITLGQVSHSPTGLTVHYARSKGNGHAAILVLRGSTVVLERRVTPHVFRFGYHEVPPGRYTIALVAIDQAGNRTPHPPSFPVTVP